MTLHPIIGGLLTAASDKNPGSFFGMPEQVTISCGLAAFRDGDSPEAVQERADAALYRAREAGRNRCAIG